MLAGLQRRLADPAVRGIMRRSPSILTKRCSMTKTVMMMARTLGGFVNVDQIGSLARTGTRTRTSPQSSLPISGTAMCDQDVIASETVNELVKGLVIELRKKSRCQTTRGWAPDREVARPKPLTIARVTSLLIREWHSGCISRRSRRHA